MALLKKPTAHPSGSHRRPQRTTRERGQGTGRTNLKNVYWTYDETVCLLAHLDHWIKCKRQRDDGPADAARDIKEATDWRFDWKQIHNRLYSIARRTNQGQSVLTLAKYGSRCLTKLDRGMKEAIQDATKKLRGRVESNEVGDSPSTVSKTLWRSKSPDRDGTPSSQQTAVGNQVIDPEIQEIGEISNRENALAIRRNELSRRENALNMRENAINMRENTFNTRETNFNNRQTDANNRETAERIAADCFLDNWKKLDDAPNYLDASESFMARILAQATDSIYQAGLAARQKETNAAAWARAATQLGILFPPGQNTEHGVVVSAARRTRLMLRSFLAAAAYRFVLESKGPGSSNQPTALLQAYQSCLLKCQCRPVFAFAHRLALAGP